MFSYSLFLRIFQTQFFLSYLDVTIFFSFQFTKISFLCDISYFLQIFHICLTCVTIYHGSPCCLGVHNAAVAWLGLEADGVVQAVEVTGVHQGPALGLRTVPTRLIVPAQHRKVQKNAMLNVSFIVFLNIKTPYYVLCACKSELKRDRILIREMLRIRSNSDPGKFCVFDHFWIRDNVTFSYPQHRHQDCFCPDVPVLRLVIIVRDLNLQIRILITPVEFILRK